ncbi:uncharacterized protein LOC119176038 [Rhipicephalus microplus]|uniref:uncharacterized protein LOC119176038 n=1 Tax=Rhipicephalus microplus TaxID=6941 RepID=UPI001888B4EE|nr:zinc finger protein 624-like [Rhipicephalus microplus]
METRVFINMDVEPFCTRLVFPVGVPAAGYVRIIFGDFAKTCSKYRSANDGAAYCESDVTAAVNSKVFVQSPSVDGEPLCTLKLAALPEDLSDDSVDVDDDDDSVTVENPDELQEEPQDVCEELAPQVPDPEEPNEPSEAQSSSAPAPELSSDRRKQKNPMKIRLRTIPLSPLPDATRRSSRTRNAATVRYISSSSSDDDFNRDSGDSDWSGADESFENAPKTKRTRRVSAPVRRTSAVGRKATSSRKSLPAKKVSAPAKKSTPVRKPTAVPKKTTAVAKASISATEAPTPKIAPLNIKALKQQSKERQALKASIKAKSDETFSCEECGQTFSSRLKYKKHSWTHKPKNEHPHRCDVCDKLFATAFTLERHQAAHCKGMPNCCEKCRKGFATPEELAKHEETHKDYRCECCSQLYLSYRGLRKHYTQFHKSEMLQKQQCSATARAEGATGTVECEDGAGQKEHKCVICDLGCDSEDALAAHYVEVHPEQQVFPCETCRKVFTDRDMLQTHLRKHMQIKTGANSSEQTYLCNICDKELKSLSTLRVHVQSHNKVRSFKCDICQEKYTTASNLRKHRKIHNTTRMYKCPHCPKEFTTNNYKLKHVKRVHTRDFQYGCSHCPKKFLEKKRFQQHMVLMHASMLTENDYATMTLVKKLHCSQCAYVTYSSKSFRQHEVTHTGKYPHICNECNKGFTFRFELTKHVRCVHQAQFFRCESCKRTFTAEETYKIHKEHHDRGLGFTCTECGNMYETQGHYEQHMQAHSSDLPYECPICNKRFALTRSLNLHRLSHDKQRTPRPRPYNGNRNWDYYCELCNVFYKYGSSLVAHRVCVHGNGPTTTCPYCEKKFNSRLTLSMHIRMHTRERPMRCSYCGKTFRVWNSLKRHVVTSHTKDFKLFCPLCNKGFVSRSYLKVHLKSAHKAVMSGPGKRKRLPDGPAVAQHPPARTTTVQKPPVIIPMPAKLDRSTLAPQARRPRHHPAKAASVSITPVATQLPMVHPPTQVDAPQRPQQPPQPQQLPLERPELQQQAQLQQLHLQQLQLQPSQMHPQHLQPSRQHAQQRDLFEMQQIPHLETDTYSLMLL